MPRGVRVAPFFAFRPPDRLGRMPKKKPTDPQLQALVDQALASGDPLGFVHELTRQLQGDVDAQLFPENPEIELPDPPLHPTLLTVRVDIVGARPPIWRRLELRGDLTLADVHDHLQASFGWLNAHLHHFDAPGAPGRRPAYFITEFDAEEGETGTDEREVRLDQVLREPGEKLRYTYDFGDDWEHQVAVESVRPATEDDPPARCTAGRNSCPPEDVGGIHTWNTLAAALRADPDRAHLTGDLQMYADWLPRDCDPDDFSVADANVAIALVGADADEVIRSFQAAHDTGLPLELPQPRTEFAELLGACTTEVRDVLGQIAARAIGLDDEVADADVRAMLRPWRTVLDVIGEDGVQLTGAGWLPPKAVEQIRDESGVARSYGKGNREQHTPEVAAPRERCVRAGLLRKRKGRLLLTKRGLRCRESDDELLTAIAESLVPDKQEAVRHARVISLLFLAADWQIGPDSRWAAHAAERGTPLRPWEIEDAFWDDVAHLMSDIGWRVDDRLPITRDDLRWHERTAVGALKTDRPLQGLPHSPVVRKIAKAALFE